MAGGVMISAATPATTTEVIPIEKGSAPPETSVIKATPFREPDAETQVRTDHKKTLQPMSVQTAEKTFEEDNNKGNSHKRKHNSNLKGTAEEALIADISDNNDYNQPLSAWINGGKSSNDSDHLKLSTPVEQPQMRLNIQLLKMKLEQVRIQQWFCHLENA